jgi:hypothetical protein
MNIITFFKSLKKSVVVAGITSKEMDEIALCLRNTRPQLAINDYKIKEYTKLDFTIDHIQEIRAVNNKLWMDLLRVAAEYAPDETKRILKKINANDKKISKLLGEIK